MQWSLATATGAVPPPCWGFSFTKIDDHHVVLFGGHDGNYIDDVYILDLANMVRLCYLFSNSVMYLPNTLIDLYVCHNQV